MGDLYILGGKECQQQLTPFECIGGAHNELVYLVTWTFQSTQKWDRTSQKRDCTHVARYFHGGSKYCVAHVCPDDGKENRPKHVGWVSLH